MAGVGRLLDHLPDEARCQVVFIYAGGEHELVGRITKALEGRSVRLHLGSPGGAA